MMGGVLPIVSEYKQPIVSEYEQKQSIADRINNAVRNSEDFSNLVATVNYKNGDKNEWSFPYYIIGDFIAEGHDANRKSITLTWKEKPKPEKVWELKAVDYTEYFKTWEDLVKYIKEGNVMGGSQPYTISMVDLPEGATVYES